MTTATPADTRCNACGAAGRRLNDREQCSDCEVRELETDSWAGQALRDTLGAAATAALDYLHGDDVRLIVSEAVTEGEDRRTNAGMVPSQRLSLIDARLHEARGKRIAAREAEARLATGGD